MILQWSPFMVRQGSPERSRSLSWACRTGLTTNGGINQSFPNWNCQMNQAWIARLIWQ